MPLTFPAGFDKCVRGGGKVRTIKVGDKEQYMHVCYLGGKSYSGEVKSKKEASEVSTFLKSQGYVEKDNEFIKASTTHLRKLIPQIALSEIFSSSDKTSEIEVLHAGVWEHPQYGTIRITEADIDKFMDSFNEKVRKVDIAVDQEHMPEKGAAGWFRSMKKVFEEGKTKLKATIEWTKLGTQLIQDGIFKYFSPEFDFAYEDMETHEQFENVLLGGALTNRPYFKSLAPVALSENMFAAFAEEKETCSVCHMQIKKTEMQSHMSKVHPNKIMKGGENRMLTKDELKAKLAENAEFALEADASDEEKAAFEEAKAEIAKDAEDKEEADRLAQEEADKKKADEEAVKASEKFISKADHVKEMNEMKSKMGVMEAKLRFKEVSELVDGYVFSESNQKGVLLPKDKKAAVELMMAATPKVADMFKEFLKGLPTVSAKLFTEQGGEGVEATKAKQLEDAITKKMSENAGMKYSEALKIVGSEQPELLK